MWKAVHPDDYDGLAEAYTSALARGDILDQTYRIITPSGEVRVVRGRADVVLDAAGEPAWVYGMVQDVTEQEQIKQAISEHAAGLAAVVAERTLELQANGPHGGPCWRRWAIRPSSRILRAVSCTPTRPRRA